MEIEEQMPCRSDLMESNTTEGRKPVRCTLTEPAQKNAESTQSRSGVRKEAG